MDFINKHFLALLTFCFLLSLQSCKITKQKDTNVSIPTYHECNLIPNIVSEVDYSNVINTDILKYEFNEFEKNTSGLDILHLYIKSGTKKIIFSRSFMDEQQNSNYRYIDHFSSIDTLIKKRLPPSNITHNPLSFLLKGSYVADCFNVKSSPFYNIYIIKYNGEYICQLNLDNLDLTNLKSNKTIELLTEMKEVGKSFIE